MTSPISMEAIRKVRVKRQKTDIFKEVSENYFQPLAYH
jgi:hypothetical protein